MQTILFFPRSLKNGHMGRQLTNLAPNVNVQSASPNQSVETARDLIAFWKPSGCIVNDDRLPAEIFKGVPTTFLHRDPSELPSDADYVTFDENEIGRFAAQELLSLDLASYAYVGDAGAEFWNTERQRAFVRAMKLNGRDVDVLTPAPDGNVARMQSELVDWLRARPRPVGVFAACDSVSELVAAVSVHAGLSIPEDIVLLGVDNNEDICENGRPTLSSIACDLQSERRTYLDHLLLRIAEPGTPSLTLRIQPQGLVRRASTRRFRRNDSAVQAACETIRKQACSGLTAREVVGLFPCSRRMAEIRFRTVTGMSILEAIRMERKAAAERLLRDGQLTTEMIANRCGYASFSSVYRLLNSSSVAR